MSAEALQSDNPDEAKVDRDRLIMEAAADMGDEAAAALDQGEAKKAAILFQKAFQKLPEPRREWEQATFFLSGQADAHLQLGEWKEAKVCASLALTCAVIHDKPLAPAYIHKQLGIAEFELHNINQARIHLGCALVANDAGRKLFAEDDHKYFHFISKCMKPPHGKKKW